MISANTRWVDAVAVLFVVLFVVFEESDEPLSIVLAAVVHSHPSAIISHIIPLLSYRLILGTKLQKKSHICKHMRENLYFFFIFQILEMILSRKSISFLFFSLQDLFVNSDDSFRDLFIGQLQFFNAFSSFCSTLKSQCLLQ